MSKHWDLHKKYLLIQINFLYLYVWGGSWNGGWKQEEKPWKKNNSQLKKGNNAKVLQIKWLPSCGFFPYLVQLFSQV